MAATQVIIVYSPNQNLRRRVIIPETDGALSKLLATCLIPGEKGLVVSLDDYETYGPDALIGWLTMEVPASDRCALVSSGTVLDVVLADPLIDVHPEGELIPSDIAEAGWELKEDGTLHKPVVVPFGAIGASDIL